MNEVVKTFVLLISIAVFSVFLLSVLGWTGYIDQLSSVSAFIENQIDPNSEEVQALQKREIELIAEIENQKILDAIKEQQRLLEEEKQSLLEQEKNIQALASSLEEEKNQFLTTKELTQQSEEEKLNYQQKVENLATTFTSMPPERAVERILALKDDLLIIDVMKAIDLQASEDGLISITPLYYSLMGEEDASRILKKSTVTF